MRARFAHVVALVLTVLGAACSENPEVAKRRHFDQGNSYMESNKYPEAIISYRNAVDLDDRFGEARLKLAQAYAAAGDPRNALREAVRAADLLPDNLEAQLTAGSMLLLGRQHADARARALRVLAKDPRNSRGLVLLGNALAGLKDLDGAIEQVEAAIDQDPQIVLSYANLGALQIAKGDLQAAEHAFRRAVEAAPTSFQAHGSLANFLWATGRLPEAEAAFKAALALEPTSASVNRALAALYMSQNKPDEAERYLKSYAEHAGTADAKFALADHYVRVRKPKEASQILAGLAASEFSADATLRLAALDFMNGRRSDAHKKLEEVLQREPRNAQALESKVRYLLIDGKNADALVAATALVKVNPRAPRNQYTLGLALEATGSRDEAFQAFRAALAAAPASVPIQNKVASLHLARGNFREGLQLAQQVVKARPQSAAAHLLYARALLQSGDMANAERELLMLEKAVPLSAEVHTWTGMLHEAKKETTAARRSFERALELNPDADLAVAGVAAADLAENKVAAALARIEAQTAKRPNDPTLAMMSGMAYMAVRDMSKAEAAFRRLLVLEPNNIDAYGRLGAIYLRQNRLQEAAQTFQEVAAKQPDAVAVAETMLGTILLQQGKPTEARGHFERAVQANPRAAVAANNLAWDYVNNGGNLDTALQLAQSAKAEIPNNASVTDTLGWVYYHKGLTSLAITTLKEALTLNANSANIHYHLGLAYLKNGNKTEARSTLQHVLKLNPAFPAAAEVRRALATIEG